MIAMRMTSTYDEYRRDRIASAPVYTAPAYPLYRAMMHALAMFGLGVGGVTGHSDDISAASW